MVPDSKEPDYIDSDGWWAGLKFGSFSITVSSFIPLIQITITMSAIIGFPLLNDDSFHGRSDWSTGMGVYVNSAWNSPTDSGADRAYRHQVRSAGFYNIKLTFRSLNLYCYSLFFIGSINVLDATRHSLQTFKVVALIET